MKYMKKFKNKPVYNYKYEIGYIIYERPSWINEHYPLLIMQIYDVPVSSTRYNYYCVHELYQLEDDKLIFLNKFDPKQINKDQLEECTIYHTEDLEDAKDMIFILNNSKKYNL